jgi:Fe/S biogenesis protein NfuA
MLTITTIAQQKLLELWIDKKETHHGLVIAISGRTQSDFEYLVRFIPNDEDHDYVATMELFDMPVFSDDASITNLKGSTLDFVMGGGFRIDNPNSVWTWSDPLSQAIQDVLTKSINPQIASHGGSVELLEVKDNVAYIKMGGGCVGCGMVDVTLKQGVEVAIKAAVPEITAIIDTTDHAKGTNPYFQETKGGGQPQHQPAKGGEPQHQPAKGGEPQHQPAKGGEPQHQPAKGGGEPPRSPFA